MILHFIRSIDPNTVPLILSTSRQILLLKEITIYHGVVYLSIRRNLIGPPRHALAKMGDIIHCANYAIEMCRYHAPEGPRPSLLQEFRMHLSEHGIYYDEGGVEELLSAVQNVSDVDIGELTERILGGGENLLVEFARMEIGVFDA